MAFEPDILELSLHGILIGVSFVTLVHAIQTYVFVRKQAVKAGGFRDMILFFVISLAFSTVRWVGGTLARLQSPIMDSELAILIWTLSGVLAAIFALLAFFRVSYFAKTLMFYADERS